MKLFLGGFSCCVFFQSRAAQLHFWEIKKNSHCHKLEQICCYYREAFIYYFKTKYSCTKFGCCFFFFLNERMFVRVSYCLYAIDKVQHEQKAAQQETYAIVVSSHLPTALNRLGDNIKQGMNSLFRPLKLFLQNLTLNSPFVFRAIRKFILI